MLKVLDQLPKAQHQAGQQMLRAVAYATTRKDVAHQRNKFEAWC